MAKRKKASKKAVKKGSKRVVRKPKARKPSPKRPAYRKPPDYRLAIKEALDRAVVRAGKSGVEAVAMTVRNADRTVDGEARFFRPKGEETRSFIIDVERYCGKLPPGTWISVGVRMEPTTNVLEHVKDPATGRYDMMQGMLNVGIYAQRIAQKAANFLAAREMAERLEKTVRRRIDECFVRLRWDARDKKPPRPGKAIPKRRKAKSKKRPKAKKRPDKKRPVKRNKGASRKKGRR